MQETVDDIYPSRFIKGKDVKKLIKVTISKSEKEDFPDKPKIVLGFDELDKEFVLNKTNALKMEKITGTGNFREWVGEVIILFPVVIPYKGEDTPGIRVKSIDEIQEEEIPEPEGEEIEDEDTED